MSILEDALALELQYRREVTELTRLETDERSWGPLPLREADIPLRDGKLFLYRDMTSGERDYWCNNGREGTEEARRRQRVSARISATKSNILSLEQQIGLVTEIDIRKESISNVEV